MACVDLYDKYSRIFQQEKLSERDQDSIRRTVFNRSTGKNLTDQQVVELREMFSAGRPYLLPEGQVEKLRRWLMDRYKTPTGLVVKNCQYRGMERSILDHFKTIMLWDYWMDLDAPFGCAVPVWRVYAKNGFSFDYRIAYAIDRSGDFIRCTL